MNDRHMKDLGMDDQEAEVEQAYRARSAQLRGLAAHLSGDARDTVLDVADHWDTLALQAETVARAKKLIRDWEQGKSFQRS